MLNDPETMTGAMWALITIAILLGFLAVIIITVIIIKHIEKRNKIKKRQKREETYGDTR